ncbi:MAG: hypothetical protein E7042_08490, partial [Lentisphaerae bacterium]|nr:hypothetical protein [Lentisphaerota bacterium]
MSNHPVGEFGYFLLTQKMQIEFSICRACGLSPFFINKNGFRLRQGCGGQAGTWAAFAALTHNAFALSNHPVGEFGYFLLTQKMQIEFSICRACGLSPFFINKNGFRLRQGCGGQAGTWAAFAALTHNAFALSNHPVGE